MWCGTGRFLIPRIRAKCLSPSMGNTWKYPAFSHRNIHHSRHQGAAPDSASALAFALASPPEMRRWVEVVFGEGKTSTRRNKQNQNDGWMMVKLWFRDGFFMMVESWLKWFKGSLQCGFDICFDWKSIEGYNQLFKRGHFVHVQPKDNWSIASIADSKFHNHWSSVWSRCVQWNLRLSHEILLGSEAFRVSIRNQVVGSTKYHEFSQGYFEWLMCLAVGQKKVRLKMCVFLVQKSEKWPNLRKNGSYMLTQPSRLIYIGKSCADFHHWIEMVMSASDASIIHPNSFWKSKDHQFNIPHFLSFVSIWEVLYFILSDG